MGEAGYMLLTFILHGISLIHSYSYSSTAVNPVFPFSISMDVLHDDARSRALCAGLASPGIKRRPAAGEDVVEAIPELRVQYPVYDRIDSRVEMREKKRERQDISGTSTVGDVNVKRDKVVGKPADDE